MAQAIKEGDWIIHVGDYTSIDTVEGLIRWKGDKFKGVFGNADPLSVRKILPDKVILEIKGKKIGHDWVVLNLNYKRKRRPKRR